MSFYKIADLNIQMECLKKMLQERSKKYFSSEISCADIKIDMDNEKLENLSKRYPQLSLNELEYIYTGCIFADNIFDFNGFCLHSSAVALDHVAVLFSAPCGTGKSTHTSLWQDYFGKDRAVIINDDKPALRFVEDAFYVYGTPWSGKNNLNSNIKVPLKAIVFLEQAENNSVRRLDAKEALKLLINQSLRPLANNEQKMEKLLGLLDLLLERIPIYKLKCNISTDAVKLIYNVVNLKT
ncbi:UNVERIFIED_CONTAM: hypothetical protein Cloal_2445 [Acetivibrio alkalicellulosi]